MKIVKHSIFILLLFFVSNTSFAQTIYVSLDGNDNNDGSENHPYKTFSKAVSVMSSGATCIIKEGVYEQTLIVNKNGTAANNLTFKAAPGERVEIRATNYINGWQQHTGAIYKTSVDMNIDSRFRVVYHQDELMNIARWPNDSDANRWTIDCTPVTGGDGSHFLIGGGIQDIDWTGGMVYYLGAHSGTSWTRTITSNTNTRINYDGVDITKWPFSNHNPTWIEGSPDNKRGQVYLFNKLEALDTGREWYYDQTNKILYFQTENGTIPAENSVSFAVTKYSVELKGDYITLKDIHVFGGSVKIHNNADNNTIENCTILHGSEGHDALNNTSAQVGEAALEVLGDNTVITGCTINHSNVSGIVLAGWAASNCLIEKNTILNTDYLGIHASPIRCSASNSKVLKNYIQNAGRDGMYVTSLNFEVAYNDVSYSQKINSDSGIFYTVGNSNLRNAEIHHNWFHDATAPAYSHDPSKAGKAAGIYLDNDSKGFTVHHNVVWNVSWTGYQVNWNNTNLDFFHNTIWNPDEAMASWVNGFSQENNKIYNNYSSHPDWFAGENGTEFDIKNNLIDANSPFEDAENQNFYPKSGSAVVDKAPTINGFDKPYKGASPDIGAYELGGTRWTAGIDAIEDTGEGLDWSIYDTKFTIKTYAENCSNKNNGKISIDADFYEDYILSFNGENLNFTKNIIIENISPNTYDLCISLASNTSESQCFELRIDNAPLLKSNTSIKNNEISFSMENGTAPYSIAINDIEVKEVSIPNFSLKINEGDIVSVTSSKECEGKIIEKIDLSTITSIYPNPTADFVHIKLPIEEGKIQIEIFDLHSKIVASKIYTIVNHELTIDLKNYKSGIYFTKLNTKTPQFIKIIKR
ncbi:T9SS type A sorting domain-containing protein [Flavicella marina]|uniref:T9SS type A sorting domain-containing protein n=1 Tax=Flavicella marina TaxID=1475951 RepID=UPI001264C021|nr:T9SS type A sorting domain-containing protein [Flavicella marina]